MYITIGRVQRGERLLEKALLRTPFLRFLPENLVQSLVQYQRSLGCTD